MMTTYKNVDFWIHEYTAMKKQRDTAEAHNKALTACLRAWVREFTKRETPDMCELDAIQPITLWLTMGDIREARKLLASLEKETP
jgi:hypothetical protein